MKANELHRRRTAHACRAVERVYKDGEHLIVDDDLLRDSLDYMTKISHVLQINMRTTHVYE